MTCTICKILCNVTTNHIESNRVESNPSLLLKFAVCDRELINAFLKQHCECGAMGSLGGGGELYVPIPYDFNVFVWGSFHPLKISGGNVSLTINKFQFNLIVTFEFPLTIVVVISLGMGQHGKCS